MGEWHNDALIKKIELAAFHPFIHIPMDLASKPVRELKVLAKERGLPVGSRATKAHLVALLGEQHDPSSPRLDVVPRPLPPDAHCEPLKPLIKWSGGKGDEIKLFVHHFPTNYTTYIEPFVGGGAVYFHLRPPRAILSDVHPELVALYRCIASGQALLIHDFMTRTPNDEATYYRVRDTMCADTELNMAMRFYYLRKTCFRGMMRYNKQGQFNIPFGRYKQVNYSDLMNTEYSSLLCGATIENLPFEDIFAQYDNPDSFVFLDPPYDSEFTDYGYCKFDKDHHRRLAECFKSAKAKCLMIIGKTPFIESLYEGYIVEEYHKKYRFKLYAGRVGDEINTTHLVIKNYT